MTPNNEIETQALVIAEAAFRKEFGAAPFECAIELAEPYGIVFRSGIKFSAQYAIDEPLVEKTSDPAVIGREVANKFKVDFAQELRKVADELEGKF